MGADQAVGEGGVAVEDGVLGRDGGVVHAHREPQHAIGARHLLDAWAQFAGQPLSVPD